MHKKQTTRKHMRELRSQLSPNAQKQASAKLSANLFQQHWFLTCKNIALYLPNNGEISPEIICHKMWAQNKNCYLPTIHPWQKRQLLFAPFTPTTSLKKNTFGIYEPTNGGQPPIKVRLLDAVLVPLVAFDKTGNRLGMGGGFYDKTFAFKQSNRFYRKPLLIGIAHHFQEIESLSIESWDIKLDAIATDQGYFRCR